MSHNPSAAMVCYRDSFTFFFIQTILTCSILRGSPLWSSGQRSGFDSRRYRIFWVVVGLEQDPLSLVSTTEKLLERKSSGPGQENRDYDLGIRHADHVAPSIRKHQH
jgi:hypothetical protein